MRKLSKESIFIVFCFFGLGVIFQALFVLKEAMCVYWRWKYSGDQTYTIVLHRIDEFMIMWNQHRLWLCWLSGATITGLILILVGWVFMDWKDEWDYAKKYKEKEDTK